LAGGQLRRGLLDLAPVIYHIFANRSNAGDWLSARGIQALLAPWRVTELLCDTPFVPETLAALETATDRDFIVIGGGGLFMDYFVPFWEGFRPMAERVPFAIWGAGCCDMKREATRLPLPLLGAMVDRARLCVVRDELTRQYLARPGLAEPVPCPALISVVTAPPTDRGRLLHVDHLDNVGVEVYEEMVRVGRAFSERTGRVYSQTNNLLPAGQTLALQRIVQLYAAADLVLTSRLHGCILALATGRRVLVVSGDRKVESFMAAAGLSDWVVDLDAVGRLPERLERLAEQEVPVAFVERARAQNRAVATRLRSLLAAQLEPHRRR